MDKGELSCLMLINTVCEFAGLLFFFFFFSKEEVPILEKMHNISSRKLFIFVMLCSQTCAYVLNCNKNLGVLQLEGKFKNQKRQITTFQKT